MSPYHGYPFGKVKVERGLFAQVRPWHLIEALMEHATHAGRVVTRREADGVLGLLCEGGSYTSRFHGRPGVRFTITTTLKPRLTTVSLHTAGRRP